MFPVATAVTFARNLVHRGILAFLQFLSGLVSKAQYGSARLPIPPPPLDLLRMLLRCLPGHHGLMGLLTVLTF